MPVAFGVNRRQELRDVMNQSVRMRGVTTIGFIQTGTAAIKKTNIEPRFAQPPAGVTVPSGMALNPVQGDDKPRRRLPRFRFDRRPVSVAQAIAVGGGETPDLAAVIRGTALNRLMVDG